MSNNNLDEMQEQKLLKIEHNSAWLAFWGLLAAIVIQVCLGANFYQIAAEWSIFVILAIYIGVGCLRAGIWDRKLKPSLKASIISSLIAAVVTGLIFGLSNYLRYKDIFVSLFTTGLIAVSVLVLCFAVLETSRHIYKNKTIALENKCNDEAEK